MLVKGVPGGQLRPYFNNPNPHPSPPSTTLCDPVLCCVVRVISWQADAVSLFPCFLPCFAHYCMCANHYYCHALHQPPLPTVLSTRTGYNRACVRTHCPLTLLAMHLTVSLLPGATVTAAAAGALVSNAASVNYFDDANQVRVVGLLRWTEQGLRLFLGQDKTCQPII